jgi:condensin complex subunit 2
VSTITKNPETLNARLDTYPLVDPFFAKLNSMVGDINSSKRLMQNIIPTVDSNLKLRQNDLIWDSQDIELPLEPEYNINDPSKIVTITSVVTPANNLIIRNGLKNYIICDAPMENTEEPEVDFKELLNETAPRNMSHVELQFDINAEVEPIPAETSFVMDFGDMDENDFDDVDEAAMIAVNRCKGLKRQAIMIEDMQPETAVHLEYSYRPLDNIDQLWAGPSHWKFRQSRRTHASVGARQTSTTEEINTAKQRPKIVRRRKLIKNTEVCLEDFQHLEENDTIILVNKKVKGTQISIQSMTKKWDHKKLKLPVDHKLPNDLFDSFFHAASLKINSNPDATFTGNDEGVPYDYENENDRNYCSRIADVQSDTETETNTDLGQLDNNAEFDVVESQPPCDNVDEIPDFYLGAPERVEKIQIAFAKRAKNIDMKQLKNCSWNLINRKRTVDPFNNPCFSDTLHELPKVLSKTMAENMSMPLAFYAILHLCNDKGLVLTPKSSLKDFEIGFVNSVEI